MAETLVQQIKNNAGKQWSRNTVADGNWLNTNTVQKFNQNDETLARAIDSLSAEMEHFTPEITPSAWPCAANKTIQNIEQNADGSLNVTYQPIESSSTSDESLWSLFYQNEYDNVLATYSEIEADINHEAGALSENLTIPAGIYDVKIEVLYKPTQGIINNKLDIAISPTTNIADALYQTFILFDDTLNVDDYQSQWITGIIDLTEGESTTLKFLIKGESAQGRYKLNHIYINSIGGAAGPAGPEGPQGPQGPTGPNGYTPTISTEIDTDNSGTKVTFSWPEESHIEPTDFTIPSGTPGRNGTNGINGDSVELESITPIVGGNAITFKWGTNTSGFNVMDGQNGAKGEDGTSVIVKSIREFNDTVGTHTKGGTEITLEWNEGQTVKTSAFSAFNGEKGQDGSGASYTFDNTTLSGTGATGDPIGVDTGYMATQSWVGQQGFLKNSDLTDYATKTYANEASAAALSQAQTWVGQQGYLTSIPNTYALKTDVEAASANALSEAETWVENKHYLTAVPAEYATKTYANEASANALSQAETYADQTFVQKSDIKNGTYGNITEVSAIGDVPIKDTKFWAINGTYESNNNYQHYIENTNTFNYYTVMVHPANTTSAASWANDNIIHIILE